MSKSRPGRVVGSKVGGMQGGIDDLSKVFNDRGRDITYWREIPQALIGFEQDEKAEFGNRAFGGAMGKKTFLRSWCVDISQIFHRKDSLKPGIRGSLNSSHSFVFLLSTLLLQRCIDFC